MKRYIYLILLVIFIGLWLSIYNNYQTRINKLSPDKIVSGIKYTNITSVQLASMLKNKDFYFLNVHTPYEGEIDKTDAFIPYDQIENNLDKLPQDKTTKIVVYCRSGKMSMEASQKLTELGYTNVYNQILGMHDWQSQGYSLKLPQPS